MSALFSWALAWPAVAAMTTGEWTAVIVAVIGTGGLSGVGTAYLGLRKLRLDESGMRTAAVSEARTVAAQEAEAAMRVMGETLRRQDMDNRNLRDRVELCEERCNECNERWETHATVCPLLGGVST